MELIIDSSIGQLVPKLFAEKFFGYPMSDELQEDFKILLTGPSDELYWFSWDNVLDEFFITEDGVTFEFYQNHQGNVYKIKTISAFAD